MRDQELPLTTIQPSREWLRLDLGQLWEYRELLYFFIWRDIKVRYKQTAIGIGWAIIQPLATMVVFSLFFGRLAQVPSDGIPYPIFAYAALLPWQLFAYSLTESSNSLVQNQQLITKVYFPRLLVPISVIFSGLFDFAIAFTILIAMMIYYGMMPGVAVAALPVFILLAILSALGVGLWLSALNVKYRDIRYAIPFLTQFWLFVTPIAYSSSLVPKKWQAIYGLNPMVGVVDGFRWALLGRPPLSLSPLLASVVALAAILTAGLYYFRRVERSFADIV